MAWNPTYRVIAGGYKGEFDLPLEGLLGFLSKFKPDPCWAATCYEVYDIKTGEKVAVQDIPEDGYSAYD